MDIAKTKKERETKNLPSTSNIDDFLGMNWPGPEWWNMRVKPQWMPSANIKETKNEYKVELAIPGFTKKDVSIKLDNNNVLHIKGETKEKSEEKKEKYTRKEFSCSSFERSFVLPENVKKENIDAKYTEGLLTIHLPKKEVVESETRQIKVG